MTHRSLDPIITDPTTIIITKYHNSEGRAILKMGRESSSPGDVVVEKDDCLFLKFEVSARVFRVNGMGRRRLWEGHTRAPIGLQDMASRKCGQLGSTD